MNGARRPVRVLRIITGLAQGGAEESLRKLVAASNGSSVTSRVISLLSGGALKRAVEAAGAPVDELGMSRMPTPAALWRLLRVVGSWRPDVIEGWMVHGNVAASIARLAAPRARVIWNVRSALVDYRGETRLTRCLLRVTAARSSRVAAIVYNSSRAADDHESLGYDRGRRHIIRNGFETNRFVLSTERRASMRSRLGLDESDAVIGHVSRWHLHKDHQTLLEAFAALRASRPAARLVLSGEGLDTRNRDLMGLVEGLGLSRSVIALGPIAQPELLYPAFDLFALTSNREGLPNVVGEAMACGVPCVVTDVGDCAVLVGDTGRAVAVGDANGVARALSEMLAEPASERAARAQRARKLIESDFSVDRMAARYLDLYRERTLA